MIAWVRDAPRGVRPGFRRAAIVAFALLLPIAAHALWDYIEVRRLIREIEAIRAKGEPVTEAEAGRGYQRLSAEQDLAARYFMAAAVLAQPAMRGQLDVLSPLHEYTAGHRRHGLDVAAVADRLAGIIEAGRGALDLSDKATGLPFNGFVAGTSYNYLTSDLMALLDLQSVRTAHLALSGRPDDAVESARGSIRSRPVLDVSPSWWPRNDDVSLLLSVSNPSPAALRRLLADLQAWDRAQDVEKAVLGDRATFIERVFRGAYGGDPRLPHSYGSRLRGFTAAAGRPWFTHRFVDSIRGWNDLVNASRKPWPQKWTEMTSIYSRFDRMALPFKMIPQRSVEVLVVDRSSLVAVAVALYRAEHAGTMPSSLQPLVGEYLTHIPVDPGSGQPLRFKADERSFTVYGVGRDGADHGGDLVSELRRVDERGWGRRQLRGRDLGVRVLLDARTVLQKER